MAEHKENRRQKVRNNVNQKVLAINALNGESLGAVVDIHSEGFLLLGIDTIIVNNIYQIELVFDAPINGESGLSLGTQCLWNREAGMGGQSWLGFHIIDLSEKDEVLIEELSNQIQD